MKKYGHIIDFQNTITKHHQLGYIFSSEGETGKPSDCLHWALLNNFEALLDTWVCCASGFQRTELVAAHVWGRPTLKLCRNCGEALPDSPGSEIPQRHTKLLRTWDKKQGGGKLVLPCASHLPATQDSTTEKSKWESCQGLLAALSRPLYSHPLVFSTSSIVFQLH